MGGLGMRVRLAAIAMVGASVVLIATPSSAAAAVVRNPNSAGYMATITGTATTFSDSVTIPTVACAAGTTSLTEIGTGFNLSGGADVSFGAPFWCMDGSPEQPIFGAAVNLPGSEPGNTGGGISFAVLPGDVVKMSARIAGTPSVVVVTMSDAAEHASGQITEPVSGSITSASAVMSVTDGPGAPIVVPDFTPIKFSNVTVGGLPLGAYNPTGYKIANGGTLQVATSLLSPKGTFTMTFKHA